jgi:DNA-binding transcriptional MerR regulator
MTLFLTSRQVAAELGVTINHVNRLAKNGTLVAVAQMPGYHGSRLYDPLVIEALKQQRSS